MKVLACCFSPTSNTKTACSTLVDSIKRYLEQNGVNHISYIDIYDLTKPDARNDNRVFNKKYDFIIIAFPVYSQNVPDVFKEYLNNMKINCNKAVILATYGGVTTGYAAQRVAKLLEKKDIFTYGIVYCKSTHSYHDALKNKPKIDIHYCADNEIFDKFTHEFMYNMNNDKPLSISTGITVSDFMPKKLIGVFILKYPKVNMQKCTSCDECIYACPTGAISEDYSIDKNVCIKCCACVKACKYDARRCEIKNVFSNLYISKAIDKSPKSVIIT